METTVRGLGVTVVWVQEEWKKDADTANILW